MLKPILTKPVHGILHSVVNHASRVQGKNIITAVIVPALGVLSDGDAIGDFISADIDSTANYASTEGTISSVDVVITVNGSAATTATTVNYTDNVQITVTVTDSAANQRVWVRTRMVAGIAPVNTSAVSISGSAVLDGVLTVAAGSWTGVPAPDLTYQWLRDEQPISGATGSTYTITMADSETVISVRETATNSAGVESAVSNTINVPDLVVPEYQAPIVSLVSKTDTTITVEWTNPDQLDEFKFYLDAVEVGSGSVMPFTFEGLNPDTAYSVGVSAGDGVNWSPIGTISLTTDAASVDPEPEEPEFDFLEYMDGRDGVYYDIQGATGLWQDVDRTIPVTQDGDPVLAIDDVSGNGGDLSIVNAANYLVWKTNGVVSWLENEGRVDCKYVNTTKTITGPMHYGIAAIRSVNTGFMPFGSTVRQAGQNGFRVRGGSGGMIADDFGISGASGRLVSLTGEQFFAFCGVHAVDAFSVKLYNKAFLPVDTTTARLRDGSFTGLVLGNFESTNVNYRIYGVGLCVGEPTTIDRDKIAAYFGMLNDAQVSQIWVGEVS